MSSHSSDEAAAKARRFMRMRHSIPRMTESAMEAIIAYVRSHDVADFAVSRRSLYRSREIVLKNTPFGDVLMEADLQPTGGL